MITNISSLLTPALMWSGITVIPAIEPAIRIIMNVGLLISNRYQYHCKKRDFDPDLSFTKHSSYGLSGIFVTLLKLDFRFQQLDLQTNVMDIVEQGNSNKIKFHLNNSEKIYTINQEKFKLYSGTYRKLSEDFLTHKGVFKDITIPDFFSEEIWASYLSGFNQDNHYLEQVKEFVFPECFSEETLGLLKDYLARGEYALKHLDKNSLLEFFKLVDYLEMPAMEGDCVIPFLENILKNGQSELSETELKEIENSAILGTYTEQIKSLCAKIKKCKDTYNDVDFPKELAELDLELEQFIKEIRKNIFSLVFFGILPLYPVFLQTISPHTWLILEQSLIKPGSMAHEAGKRYFFDMMKMAFMGIYGIITFTILTLLANELIPSTSANFIKTAHTIYTIAKKILYAPLFVAKETGKAILFTAKTLSKIPSIVHSRLFAPKLAPI